MNSSFILPPLIIIVFICGCNSRSPEIKKLKAHYSIEDLNYFYEVAFHAEGNSNKTQPISKWNKNIKIFIGSDASAGDKAAVINAIDQINRLKLPVLLQTTANLEMADINVYFGNHEKLNVLKHIWGQGTFTATNYTINNAEVKTITKPVESTEEQNRRQSIFLEELIQVLGIVGDSYAYPLSILYEKPKNVTSLSKIDKKMLQLLYEPALLTGYTCEEFENDFAEELYHINSEKKLLTHIKDQAINKKALEQILQYGLVKKKNGIERIAKFNSPIQVRIKGNVTSKQKMIIEQAIKELNQVTEQIKLFLPNDALIHDGGIIYSFLHDDQQHYPTSVQSAVTISENLFFDKRYKTDIQITYNDSVKVDKQIALAVGNTMYQALSLINQSAPEFFNYDDGKLNLKSEYTAVLKLYYSNALPENFTKEKLQTVIEQIN
jgi:hypothetical protein